MSKDKADVKTTSETGDVDNGQAPQQKRRMVIETDGVKLYVPVMTMSVLEAMKAMEMVQQHLVAASQAAPPQEVAEPPVSDEPETDG